MKLTNKEKTKKNLIVYLRRRRLRMGKFILYLSAIGQQKFRSQRSIWAKKRMQNFWFETVCYHWNDDDWISNLRMNKESFYGLLRQIEEHITKKDTNFRRSVPADVRLAVCLYFLSHSTDYTTVSNLFGIGKSTAHGIIMQVRQVIVNKLLNKYIKLPNREELIKSIAGFEEMSGFPQIAGAIDGCHIALRAPNKDSEEYINRKGYHSVILQGLVNSNYLFTDICVGWPGKCHDARVFKNSALFKNCQSNSSFLSANLSRNIGGKNINPVIIGDAAYPLFTWLLKPYKEFGNTTNEEIYFNNCLCRCRVVVENVFGRLKGRFRCLSKLLETNVKNTILIITTCCILHNYCELHKQHFGCMTPEEVSQENASSYTEVSGEADEESDDARIVIKDYLFHNMRYQ